MKFLIWRNLIYRKFQTFSTLATISLSVAICFCVVLIYASAQRGVELAHQRLGADLIVVPADATIEPSSLLYSGAAVNVYMPKETVEAVRDVPGVRRVSPQFFAYTLTGSSCCDLGHPARLVGYDPESDWIIQPWVVRPSHIASDEVILGSRVGTPGQTRARLLGKTFRVAKVAEGTGSSLDYSALIQINEARALAGNVYWLQGIWKRQGAPRNLVSAVLVQLETGADASSVANMIQQIGNVQVIQGTEAKQHFGRQLQAFVWIVGFLGLLTLVVTFVQILARFFSMVSERRVECGLYFSLGLPRRAIASLMIGEAGILALFGTIGGLFFGSGLFGCIFFLCHDFVALPLVIPSLLFILGTVGAMFGTCLILSVMAVSIPTYRLCSIDPCRVMLDGEFA